MPAPLFTFGFMMNCALSWRPFLFLCLAFSLLGCSQLKRGSVEDDKDPHVLEGKRRLQGLDWDGAIESFERALQSNPNNATAHLELGIIYEQRKNDFGAAIYHYQRHLALRPDSHVADVVEQSIIGCKRELAKTVSYAVLEKDVQNELERLNKTNSLLRQRIDLLEAELLRRPQYITNWVTNFVRWEDPGTGSGSRLTTPTEIVQRSQPEEVEEPKTPAPVRSVAQETPRRAVTQRNPPVRQTRTPTTAANSNRERERERERTRTHTVRPGETLAVLAGKYRIPLSKLKAANPSAARGVRAGQKIVIPDR